jgi:hypothetical protein
LKRNGAYGLRFVGVSEDELLVRLDPSSTWPVLRVALESRVEPAPKDVIGEQTASVGLVNGQRALLDRRAGSAVLAGGGTVDDGRLIHPFLTVVATVFAWWRGHDAFHAGAFMADGAAWAVLGGRESGKSSQLAALALQGLSVLTDDLLVVTGLTAFAGPRCVDLRPDAARALGLADRTETVRGGERMRLRGRGTSAEVTMGGLVFLAWGPGPVLRPLRPAERLERLTAQMSFPARRQSAALQMAELPGWELRRPREWRSVEGAVGLLGDLVS